MSALEGHAPDPVQMLHSTGIAATDVGRPVAHLPCKFTDGELIENATRVMASAVPIDAEVRSHSGRDYLWRTLPDLTRDRRILGAVITFTDISNRRQMESALQRELQNAQRLRVSAEAANRAMDEFIATVSHDLRTPLNTIRLWSRMFASGKVPEQTLLEGARMIGRAAAAQQQLIDDLVDLASLVCGRLRLELCDTQLSDVIAGAVGMLRPLADRCTCAWPDAKTSRISNSAIPGRAYPRICCRTCSTDYRAMPVTVVTPAPVWDWHWHWLNS